MAKKLNKETYAKLTEGGVNTKPTKATTIEVAKAEFEMNVERGGFYLREDVGVMRMPDGRKVELSRSLNGMHLFTRFENDGVMGDWIVTDLRKIYESMCDELVKRTNS